MNTICRKLALLFSVGSFLMSYCVADAADTTFIKSVQVFDGERILPTTHVLIRQGTITQIAADLEPTADAEIIDGAGKTLLPGLIDSHTHTFYASHLEQALVFGVTTELDMFTEYRFAAQMRSQQKSGTAAGRADLRSAGTLVTAAGGHGTQFGLAIPTISGPEQADEFVKQRIEEGSEYIKIVYDDGQTYGLQFPTINRETLAAVIKAAHAREKMAVAHVGTLQAARDAMDEGIDGLVHIFVDTAADDAFVRVAVERKIFIVPTLTVLEGLSGKASGETLVSDERLAPYIAAESVGNLKTSFGIRARARASFAAAIESVKKLAAAGVPILVGSDAANPGTAHGVSVHREMELLVSAGLSPVAALAAATSVPAKKFGLSDRGRIAPGFRADLVLVDGDPAKDIRATRAIVGVWKTGQRLDRDSYRRTLDAERKKLAETKTASPPANSEAGLVSDFEAPILKTEFGAGWSVSTDVLVGGKSTAESKIMDDGAGASKRSLLITGKIDEKPEPRWAGMMFCPGNQMFSPANLSSKKRISFWAKGDGKTYSVMLFFKRLGFQPAIQNFIAEKEWKHYEFAVRDFNGCDGTDIMGLFFGGGPVAGEFAFQIDDVRFEK